MLVTAILSVCFAGSLFMLFVAMRLLYFYHVFSRKDGVFRPDERRQRLISSAVCVIHIAGGPMRAHRAALTGIKFFGSIAAGLALALIVRSSFGV